jgi:hypothetical protein
MGDAAEAESEEGKEDVEVVIADPAEWYTSEYGCDPPGEAWNAQDEQGAGSMGVDIRRMSLEHPCVKQGNDQTHKCIKPMPGGKIGCGKYLKPQNVEAQKECTHWRFQRAFYSGDAQARGIREDGANYGDGGRCINIAGGEESRRSSFWRQQRHT